MVAFTSVTSYQDFEKSVRRKARYIYDDEVQGFLKVVMETSNSRSRRIPTGTPLWRAQRGYILRMTVQDGEEFEEPDAYLPERMKPTPEFAVDGRVNPRGIPCLYLATNDKTAMSEVRPWVGASVSLAEFRVVSDCKVVDCSMDKVRSFDFIFHEDAPNPEDRERAVWGDIAHALSKPVTPEEPTADDIPTQILAESFRAYGFDGIIYNSNLGN